MFAQPVTEQSQVAEARRRAVALAAGAGFDQGQAGRVAIAVTELATNLLKHGGGGEILAGLYDDPAQDEAAAGQGKERPAEAGVEIIALDKGPGMADVAACLADGYSTAGSAGQGLGAVWRQAHAFHVTSWPGRGSALLARFLAGPAAPLPRPSLGVQAELLPPWGGIVLAKQGEEASGDAWCARDGEAGPLFMVADGLGHGPDAAEAAGAAVRTFRRQRDRAPTALLEDIHVALRATRGAAVAIAQLDRARHRVVFAGIGNIAGVLVADGQLKRMVSLNGTAGHNARKFQAFDYPLASGLLIMHSDGLTSSWSLAGYPGLTRAHPTLIAAVLYRDYTRGRDDVTVLVARSEAAA